MYDVEQLIAASEQQLEQNSQSAKNVGNRPHFPMMLLLNDTFSEKDYAQIEMKLQRLWPQAVKHLLKFTVKAGEDEQASVCDMKTGAVLAPQDILVAMDTAQTGARGVFESQKEWQIYQIIDTTDIRSVDQFRTLYELNKKLETDLGDTTHKDMLIVLLNDSGVCRDMAKQIRRFLSERSDYDSTIVISNRTRENELYEMQELYRIVAAVLIASTNDAVSSFDNAYYSTRTATLYSKNTFTLSYILHDKHNRETATYMLVKILEQLMEQTKGDSMFGLNEWKNKLLISDSTGIKPGAAAPWEECINKLNITVNVDAFSYLPSKAAPNMSVPITMHNYSNFKRMTYDDVLTGFVEDLCKQLMPQETDIAEAIHAFEEYVRAVPVVELVSLTDDTINDLFRIMEENIRTVNEGLLLRDYTIQLAKNRARKKILYPALKKKLVAARDRAKAIIKKIDAQCEEVKQYLPLTEKDMHEYDGIVIDYFRSEEGHALLSKVCASEDFSESIKECFRGIVEKNSRFFALPFIDAWAKQLDSRGDSVYHQLSADLQENTNDMIRLSGNYPIDTSASLTVYMMHTGDANGQNDTALYASMKLTLNGLSNVQYLNTGYDDALEALTFVPCNGQNLVL